MADQRTRIVAGCMTGTSLDGLDVALVKITGTGLEMRAELLAHHALPMPEDLRSVLMSLASGAAREPLVYMRAARVLGEMHADALEQLLAGGLVPPIGSPGSLDFITAHGQTIWHAPRDQQDEPGGGPKSWQLFDPWPIVKRLKVPVCYGLRQADLIAGGEGAPLTPIADWVMYREHADLVFNLGGVMNYTFWDPDAPLCETIEAGDFCHCNLLLDGLASRLIGERYDKDGRAASSGQFDETLWRSIAKRLPAGEGSLGREDIEPLIDAIVQEHGSIDAGQLLFNAIAFVGQSIAEVVEGSASGRIVLAGGGARNQTLVQYVRGIFEDDELRETPMLSDDLGIPCEAREAMGWAVLGALSQDGVPVSMPQVTGAKDPGVAGVWAGV